MKLIDFLLGATQDLTFMIIDQCTVYLLKYSYNMISM